MYSVCQNVTPSAAEPRRRLTLASAAVAITVISDLHRMGAIGATPFGLDRCLTDGEAHALRGVLQRVLQVVVVEFGDMAALAADQELRRVIGIAVADAADIG